MFVRVLLCISLFFFSSCQAWDLRIVEPQNRASDFDLVARLDVLPKDFDVTGRAVLADPPDACSTLKNPEKLNGSIVFFQQSAWCLPLQRVMNVAEVPGVLGMVMVKEDGSVGATFNYRHSKDGTLFLPAVEIIPKDGNSILKAMEEEEVVIIRMRTPDDNPWMKLTWGPVGVIFQLGFELGFIASFYLAVWKWRQFVLTQSFQFNVPQICLGLQALSSVFRCLWFLQPLRFTKYFFPEGLYGFLETFSYSITFTTTLLITFYWQQAMNDVNKPGSNSNTSLPNLGKLKVPFLVVIGIIWTIELLGIVLRLTGGAFDVISVQAVLYAITSAFCAIFFAITGAQILRHFKQRNIHSKRSKRLRAITLMIILSSIGLTTFVLAAILFVTPANKESPALSLFVWTLVYGSLFTISISQIAAFQAPKTIESGDGSKLELSLTPPPLVTVTA